MIQHAHVNELLKSAECCRCLKFEQWILKEYFDQRNKIILLGETSMDKVKMDIYRIRQWPHIPMAEMKAWFRSTVLSHFSR